MSEPGDQEFPSLIFGRAKSSPAHGNGHRGSELDLSNVIRREYREVRHPDPDRRLAFELAVECPFVPASIQQTEEDQELRSPAGCPTIADSRRSLATGIVSGRSACRPRSPIADDLRGTGDCLCADIARQSPPGGPKARNRRKSLLPACFRPRLFIGG